MELRFVAMLCSNLGKGNSDGGHIKCSRGPQVPHPCFKQKQPGLGKKYNEMFQTSQNFAVENRICFLIGSLFYL